MGYKADSVFKNQFFNFSMQILNILFPLIAIPYTTRLFGPDILGEVNFANSIVQYFVLIAVAGIPVYGTREIAKYRDDNYLMRKKFKEIAMLQAIFTGISVISFIILISVSPTLNKQKIIYLFLGIQIVSNAFNYIWFIQGIEKYRYAAIATFISKFINVVLIFTLLNKKEDYYIYAFIIGITVFINIFINLIMSINLLKNFNVTTKVEIDSEGVKSHIYAILVFFLSDIAVKVYTAMDQTMLGIMDSKSSVGYYSMSIRLVKTILTFVTSIAVVMVPRISNSIKNNKLKEVRTYIGMSVRLVYLIAIPAIFGILAIGEEIVTLYLGSEFLQSIVIFKIASLLLLIIGLSNIFGMQIMIPYGKEKKFTIILTTAAIVNFIINMILIPKLSYFGATYATLIAELLVTVWMYIEVKGMVGSIQEVFKPWKYLIPSILFYLLIKIVIKPMIKSQILIVLISMLIAMIIYGLGLIIMREETVIAVISKLTATIKKKK